MNRSVGRRLAKNQSERSAAMSADGSATIQQNLQAAVGHHQAGRLAEAVEIYQSILARQPDHADANHLLGVAAHQNGNAESSVGLISKAIALNPENAVYHNSLGVPLRTLGRLDEAIASYRKAVALKSDYAEAHFNLGNAIREQGKPDDAVASYREALAMRPDYVEAHLNLGISLRDSGRLSEAIASFQRAIDRKPGYAEAHHSLGLAFQEAGETDKVIASLRTAVRLAPRNDGIWGDLAEVLHNISFSTIDDRLLPDLLLMLERPVVRPHAVSLAVISALRHHPDFADLLARYETGAPANDEDCTDYDGAAGRLSQIPLLLRLMGLSVLNDMGLENMLSGLRRAMMRAEAAGELAEQGLPFSAALALQCFTNEYAYIETAGESAAVETLEQRLGRLADDGGDMAPASLAAFAAYRPLHGYPWAEKLAARPWPEPIAAVIAQQLTEPLEERSLGAGIPSLTPIEDKVSQDVRDQYEENPYPRWIKAGPSHKAIAIGQHLRASVFHRDLEGYVSPDNPEILVAGCGTGEHSLATAARYRGARVLAVDLSLASLAYAQRKTRELGVSNIEYRQGDILKLNSLGRRFDLIECTGVLHHMDDPLAGWRVLAELLRPGGLMYIGLYSEAARRSVATVREMIARKGYSASPDDIRRCRKDIMDAVRGGDREMEKLVIWRDFYSISGCRDLLFHVQEHRFTIPMIEDALGRLGLSFLGFALLGNLAALRKFKQSHGGDSALTSLPLWHAFETENPDTFAGMYQFWARKA